MPLRRIGFILFLGALITCALSAWAQTPQAPPPEKVDQLIKLLADPTVKEWLSQQGQGTNPPAGAASARSRATRRYCKAWSRPWSRWCSIA